MTHAGSDNPDTAIPPGRNWAQLTGALGRISGGVQPTFRTGWLPPPAGFADAFLPEPLRRQWVEDAWDLVGDGTTPGRDAVNDKVQELAGRLSVDRELFLTALHHPRAWLDPLGPDDDHPVGLHAAWVTWCWAVEALWRAADGPVPSLTGSTPTSEVLLETDRQFARPLAARLRFLILSEAFRHRDESASAWILPPDSPAPGQRPFNDVFGAGSWADLVARTRKARWNWRDHLDTFQSDVKLSAASSEQLEAELDALLFQDSHGRRLRVTACGLTEECPPGPDDLAMSRDVIEQHLLPRFRLATVLRLAVQDQPALRATAVAVLVAGGLAVALAGAGYFALATWVAAACYLGLLFAVVAAPGPFSAPWLLRWPAAAVLGLTILAGLNPHWWRDIRSPTFTPGVPWAVAVLFAGAYGYLAIEVRNHGVPGRRAVVRAGIVLLCGLWHAALVSIIGVVAVLPAFCDGGPDLAARFAGGHHTQALLILAAATGWCLAAGVFSQILWDDRPITAPLAHQSWRAGRDS